MDLLSPEDIKGLFGSPFVSQYWPSIVGGLILFVVMIKGARWLMFIIFLLTAVAQAWHLGLFAEAA